MAECEIMMFWLRAFGTSAICGVRTRAAGADGRH